MAICKDEAAREKMHQILDLVIDINDLEERLVEVTGYKPTAWFEFIGHVNQLCIRVAKEGWEPYGKKDISLYLPCSCDNLDLIIAMLISVKEELDIE